MSDQQFEYDVFLSHVSVDRPAVRELAQRLKGDGLRAWLDEWVTRRGDSIPRLREQGPESSPSLVAGLDQAAFDSQWVQLERHTALFRDPPNSKDDSFHYDSTTVVLKKGSGVICRNSPSGALHK